MKSIYLLAVVIVLSGCFKETESTVAKPHPTVKPPATTASSPSKDVIKPSDCKVSVPPAILGLDSFYQKYCDADGIPVLSSANVSDGALQWVTYQARLMLKDKAAIVEAMRKGKTRIAIMSPQEVTTDIPEHSDLNTDFPETNWDVRARGLGATDVRPVSSAAEENILCYQKDGYRGENIFIHEFAHTLHIMGIQKVDPSFSSRLQTTYDSAFAKGLWKQTYAAENAYEYWAEGVQSWFNVNLEADPPNGIHNHVNTRAELKQYDPGLYQLISEYYSTEAILACPPKSS